MNDRLFDLIIAKHSLANNSYANSEIISIEEYGEWLAKFCNKWQHRFVKGYWNIDLGLHPKSWYAAIEDVLELVAELCPEFGICQIRIKFGGIRIYLSDISEDVFYSLDKLEDVLYDDDFVYF